MVPYGRTYGQRWLLSRYRDWKDDKSKIEIEW